LINASVSSAVCRICIGDIGIGPPTCWPGRGRLPVVKLVAIGSPPRSVDVGVLW
jgi:hypothetical protein